MQSAVLHPVLNKSGAGSTTIVPAAMPFSLPGNDIGIVIVHGYGGSIADYRAIGRLLNTQGYTVAGLRLAGHGQGQKILREVTVADCQSSVVQAVIEIRKTCRHVFLLGSSFGGVLSLDYAINHPDLTGMVLVNTALSYSGAGVFQGILLRLLRIFRPDYPKQGLTEQEKTYAQTIGSSIAWPISGIIETSTFARNTVLPRLRSVHVSALILHSQDDPVVGVENSKKLATLLGSPVKVLTAIPVATHRPFRDSTANEFMAQHINKFIQTVLAK